MLKTLIVADDSTGANASAILLNKLNFTSLSMIDFKKITNYDGFDVVAVSTDSRATSKEEAYERVLSVCKKFKDSKFKVINKRIDSTLRGNMGSELNAFKEMFPNKKIVIVPAFPNSERYCINGQLYVGETPLLETPIAKDPKTPITSSDVKELFLKQFKGTIANIKFSDYENMHQLTKELFKTHDAIIYDAKTNDDVKRISEVVFSLNYDIISVDPGPLTYYYSEIINKTDDKGQFFYLVGSVVDVSYYQIETARKDQDFDYYYISPASLLNQEEFDKSYDKYLSEILKLKKPFVIITANGDRNKVLNLFELGLELNESADNLSKIINTNYAKLATDVLNKTNNVRGAFISGGDTTLHLLEYNKANSIELIKEVLPLCVHGKIADGDFKGLDIITKGGNNASSEAYLIIKKYIEEEL